MRDSSRHEVPLPARLLVGRSTAADLTISDKAVSGEHAVVFWAEGSWKLRDLGSRNGTFVNNARAPAGQTVRLAEGDVVQFGRKTFSWVLADARPPGALARRDSDGAIRQFEDGMVCIPDSSRPLAMMFEDGNGDWVLEYDGSVRQVQDHDTVAVAGESWRLFVPEGLGSTMVASSTMGPLIEDIGLAFSVSRDEELVDIDLILGTKRSRLEARAHHYLLLTLARQREADTHMAEEERGWVYRDELESMLRLDSTHLNVQVYRARKELHEAGVTDPTRIVERRGGRLRIGVTRLTIKTM